MDQNGNTQQQSCIFDSLDCTSKLPVIFKKKVVLPPKDSSLVMRWGADGATPVPLSMNITKGDGDSYVVTTTCLESTAAKPKLNGSLSNWTTKGGFSKGQLQLKALLSDCPLLSASVTQVCHH
jgi:hypothetical protein